MYKNAIEVLKILEQHGHEAYIIGGYVRDKLLGKKSSDIDICTSATPKDIMQLFDISSNNATKYGAINIIYKKYKYDVTTFRKELKYEDNRKPVKLKYIKDLKKDLLRRDFTINTLCINSKSEILDILNVKQDLENKIIKTVGNPRYKIKEDALRILRAIRFAAILDFQIDDKTKYYIKNYSKLLKKLSYQRKKEELNKILSNPNKEKGRKLLLELKLDKHLKLTNLKEIKLCDDIIGIWTQLHVDNIYPFTKLEQEQMIKIRELLTEDLYNPYTLYKYGLYLTTVASSINEKDIKKINKIYNNLPIYNRKEINITSLEITKILNKKPGNYLKKLFIDLEINILNNKLKNEKEELKQYILNKYKKD